jgi:Holliday junction DNA helicase RuvB
VDVDNDGLLAIAEASRGIPRIANSNLEWIRDCQLSQDLDTLGRREVVLFLKMKGIDENGLTKNDRRYIEFLRKIDKPVGLETIAASLGIDKDTLKNVVEPFLMEKGMILRTTKGRILL